MNNNIDKSAASQGGATLFTQLRAEDLADLRRSGLSDATIAAMCVESLDVLQLRIRLGSDEILGDGYAIPYFSRTGEPVRHANYRLHHPDDKKYRFPFGSEPSLYFPPGVADLLEQHDYLVVTEGEKKAARAVQDGIPCVALPGVWNWADPAARAREKAIGLTMSHLTPVLPDLAQLGAAKRIILLFDSDVAVKPQVKAALYTLRDALRYQCAPWVRRMHMPTGLPGMSDKVGLDDLLNHPQGRATFDNALATCLEAGTETMSPILRFAYDVDSRGQPLHYVIPNIAVDARFQLHQVLREVEEEDDDGNAKRRTKVHARTPIWLNRVIQSIDGDDLTFYEVGFVPLDQRAPRYITGGGDLLNMTSRSQSDPFSDRGARIMAKDRQALDEFLHACNLYGLRAKVVKKTLGTRRRGWLSWQGETLFVTPGIVHAKDKKYAATEAALPVVPVDQHRDSDALLRDAMLPKGSVSVWREQIIKHVLPNALPSLIMAAGMAGLLRYWCPDSENFLLHVFAQSSAGKSTAMKASASLWGDPEKLFDQWRTTDNGLEGRCLARNHMALFLDEAGQAPNQDVLKNAVYLIGNGGEKMRASRDGGERQVRKFQLVALSNGEEALLKGSRHAGQEVRTLDLPADICGPLWGTSFANSEEAEQFAALIKANYGHGVHAAVQALLSEETKTPGWWAKMHADCTTRLRKTLAPGTPPHIVRRVKHYGLLMVAYFLLLQYVLELDKAAVDQHFTTLYKAIATNLLSTAGDQFSGGESVGIAEHMLDGLARHQVNFLSKDNQPRGDLWGSILDNRVAIIPSAFTDMCKPYDPNRMLAILQDAGALVSADKPRRLSTVRINGATPKCYVIDSEKLRAWLDGKAPG